MRDDRDDGPHRRSITPMAHQGYDLQLIAYGGRYWRANFLPDRNRALDRERHGLGADALAGGAVGGVGRVQVRRGS
jgi:hypothetical protein